MTESIELNYHFDLNKFSDQYSQNIWRNARKNLNQALANGLVFVRCELDEQKQEAYDVIKVNRMTRGVPLRLTSDALRNTARIIEADYFLVKDSERSSIAAAIVFKVAPQIGQIIYWGDNPNYSSLKTMNFLSYKVFEYFKSKGLRCLDIGYSTVDSVPNYGLCEFKESIGCDIQPKLTFSKNL